MTLEVLKSKIHHATITEANLNYIGSLTIDEDLMDAGKGERRSEVICPNGATEHEIAVDDPVIIVSHTVMDVKEAKKIKPCIISPDKNNFI